MILFEEARNLVLAHTPTLPTLRKNINEIDSEILAEDVRAKSNLPIFSNSAMDGFALRAVDTQHVPVNLKIKGCVKAGDSPTLSIRKGESVKIMTGASLPKGADAVVMKEDAEEKDREVLVMKSLRKGENVRLKGEEIKKGKIALKKGTRLNPVTTGFLAALGYGDIKVFRQPKISLLVTGNELVTPGQKLRRGKIWESNSSSLRVALAEINIKPIFLGIAHDNPQDLQRRVQEGLKASDILLISGGISVGEYDFVQEILLRLKVRRIFWRVAIKPGKPTFFGIKGKKLIFGLPGNPASVVVTYLEFVRPAILKIMGHRNVLLLGKEAILEEKLQKKAGRSFFLKGTYREQNEACFVKSAGLQHSHILDSFAKANCLIFLGKNKSTYLPGEKVKIQILPWNG